MPTQKKYKYTITEVAKAFGVSPQTVRNWEKQGLLKAQRTQGGTRRYSFSEVKKLSSAVQPRIPTQRSYSRAQTHAYTPPSTIHDEVTPDYTEVEAAKVETLQQLVSNSIPPVPSPAQPSNLMRYAFLTGFLITTVIGGIFAFKPVLTNIPYSTFNIQHSQVLGVRTSAVSLWDNTVSWIKGLFFAHTHLAEIDLDDFRSEIIAETKSLISSSLEGVERDGITTQYLSGSIAKLPNLTSTYISDLNGSQITNVDAHHLGGVAASGFLRSNEPDTAEAVISFTASPGSMDVNGGSVYINPSGSSFNYTLFGIAVNGNQKFKVDSEGDTQVAGNLSVDGTSSFSGSSTFNGNTQINGTLGVSGATTLSSTLDVTGISTFSSTGSFADTLTLSKGTGTGLSVTSNALIGGTLGVTGTTTAAAINASGRITGTNVPSQPHTLTWAIDSGTWNVSDSSVYINPSSATADSNLLGLAVAGGVKFAVDAEGDVYARNLILTGSTSAGSSTIANLTVTDNTILGDSGSDTLTIYPNTISLADTTATKTIAAGGTQRLDLTANSANLSIGGTSGNIGIGTTAPATKFQVIGGHIAIDNTYFLEGKNASGTLYNILGTGTDNYTKIGSLGNGLHFINGAQSAVLATIMDGGNVGIGVTSPNYKLDVSGTTRFWTNSTSLPTVSATQVGTANLLELKNSLPGANLLTVSTASNELATVFTTKSSFEIRQATSVAWSAKSAWNMPVIGSGASPAFADLDNDGDYDAMYADNNGIALGYKNTGTPFSPTWTAETTWNSEDLGTRAIPAIADLDNDGDYDLLLGHSDGTTRAYENTGTTFSPTWTDKDSWDIGDIGSNAKPALADLDNDGDYDLLVGDSDTTVSYGYKNTGSVSSPTWTAEATWNLNNGSANPKPAFGDLDKDGDYDVLIGISGGTSSAYENTGTKTSPTWTANTSWNIADTGSEAKPALADLDNDGDLDVVVGDNTDTLGEAYENTGSGAALYAGNMGKIGIGTTNPQATLDIIAPSNSTAGQKLKIDSLTSGNALEIEQDNRDMLTLSDRDLTIGGHTDYTTLSNVEQTFVYETSKDIDGGRWTDDDRARGSSWYNETIDNIASSCVVDTDDRCGQRPFPSKAILVVTTTKLYIYDAKDNTLWMDFRKGATTTEQMIGPTSNSTGSSVWASNGKIYMTNAGTVGGFYVIDFKTDTAKRYNASDDYLSDKNIANRNSTITWTANPNATPGGIINTDTNDVHVQMYNGKTFAAIATDDGVSVLNETDQSAIYSYSNVTSDEYEQVWIDGNGSLWATNQTTSDFLEKWTNVVTDSASELNGTPDKAYSNNTTPSHSQGASLNARPDGLVVTDGTSIVDGKSPTVYVGLNGSFTVLNTNVADESNGSVKFYRSGFITEEMVGDAAGMWPFTDNAATTTVTDAATDTNDLTASVNTDTFTTSGVRGKGLAFTGTQTLTRADDSDFDHNAAATFSISFWMNQGTSSAVEHIYNKYGAAGYKVYSEADGDICFGVDDDSTFDTADLVCSTTGTYDDSNWHFITATKNGTSSIALYIDGVLIATDSSLTETGTLVNAAALFVGTDSDGASNKYTGSLDDITHTRELLTNSQIKHMYQVGYRALQNHTANRVGSVAADDYQRLQGSSNAALSVAVDEGGRYAYVGTSGGGISVVGLNSDTLVDQFNTQNKSDDDGTTSPSDTIRTISVSGAPSTGYNSDTSAYSKQATLAFGTSSGFWLQTENTSFQSFMANSYNPFGTNLNQSSLAVDSVLRVVNQLSTRLDNLAFEGDTEPYLAEAFRVDRNGNFLSRSLTNSTTAMQFQNAAGGTVLAIDTTNGAVVPGTDDTYDLGSNALRWRDIYLGPGSMHIGFSTSDEYVVAYDNTNNRLGFNVNGSGDAEISFDSSGNVGIGTTAPTGVLDVRGLAISRRDNSSGSLIHFAAQNLDTTSATLHSAVPIAAQFARTGDATARTAGYMLIGKEAEWTSTASTNDSYMAFYTVADGTENHRMRITSGGNVGIGTTGPTNKLHVYKGGSGVTANSDAGLVVENSTHNYFNMIAPVDTQSGLLFGGAVNNDAGVFWEDGSRGNYLGLSANAGSSSGQLVIENGGDVGIGTTNPNVKLDVIGSQFVSGDLVVGTGTYTGTPFGESPYIFAYKNDVSGVIQSSTMIGMEANNQDTWLSFLTQSTFDAGIVFGDEGNAAIGKIAYDHTTDSLSFTTAGTSRLAINGTGNIATNGTAANTAVALYVSQGQTTTSGTQQYGVNSQAVFSSGATSSGTAGYFGVHTAAASYTMGTAYGIYVNTPTKGSGSSITSVRGIQIAAQTGASFANYGMLIDAPSGAGDQNVSLYLSGTPSGANPFYIYSTVDAKLTAAGVWTNAPSWQHLKSDIEYLEPEYRSNLFDHFVDSYKPATFRVNNETDPNTHRGFHFILDDLSPELFNIVTNDGNQAAKTGGAISTKNSEGLLFALTQEAGLRIAKLEDKTKASEEITLDEQGNVVIPKLASEQITITNNQETNNLTINLESKLADLTEKLGLLEDKVLALETEDASSSAVLGESTESASLITALPYTLSISEENNLTINNDLSVLGETSLGDTSITGTLNVGLLSIENVILSDSEGSLTSLTALNTLLFQNAYGSGVEIDTHGNVKVNAELTAEKLNISGDSLGSATISRGQTEITLSNENVTSTSKIFITPSKAINIAVSARNVTNKTFTVSLSNIQTTDVTFDYWIVDND